MLVSMIERTKTGDVRAALAGPMVLGEKGFRADGRPKPGDIRILPVRPVGGAVAVALVPQSSADTASLNGVPLVPGMHPLRHADRLTRRAKTFWVAVETAAAEVEYRPEIHGQDQHCYLTKARLGPGDHIVVCPGSPGADCGCIYKAEAWRLAVASKLKCRNCGLDPSSDGQWNPPQTETRIDLDDLYRLISRAVGGDDVDQGCGVRQDPADQHVPGPRV